MDDDKDLYLSVLWNELRFSLMGA